MAELSDADKYVDAWTKTMLDIWRERIERLRVTDTGALHESFSSRIQRSEDGTTITLRFAEYGIYQALGIGYGYKHDRQGNVRSAGELEFLDPGYRHEHGLDKPRKRGPRWGGGMTSGKPRKRRDWVEKKLFMSRMALAEDLALITGEEAAMVICNELSDIRSAVKRNPEL